MKAYSIDLRQKIFECYERESISQKTLAQRFGVSLGFVQGLLRLKRKTGHLSPRPHGGGRKRKINVEGEPFLQRLLRQHPDLRDRDLCDLYEKEFKIRVDQSTMNRMLKRLNFTRKKNSSRQGTTDRTGSATHP